MKKCWYTFFLATSLAISALWVGGNKVYGKYEEVFEEQFHIQAQANTENQTVAEVQADTDGGERPEIIITPPEEEETAADGGVTMSEAETTKAAAESTENASEQETAETMQKTTEDVSEQEPVESESGPESRLFPENFQGVLFIGDSRTVGLHEYGQLGEADVFADSGMSVFNIWDSQVTLHGQKSTLEQILTENQYETIHVMLGINELGYPMKRIVEKYGSTVTRIQQMQPQARIILGANMHVTEEKSKASGTYNNQKINELNGNLKAMSQELNCAYLDINERFDDGNGNLAKEYSTDGSHILGKYYADWVLWLQEK